MKFLIFTLIVISCSTQRLPGEKKLKTHSVPEFLKSHLSEDSEVYEKYDGKKTTFEIKDDKVSLTYSESGELLEKESDLHFKDIPANTQTLIKAYLGAHYSGYKILEVEKREASGISFFDIEIRHKSSESGYWEISFDQQGNFVSREIEDYQPVETLN